MKATIANIFKTQIIEACTNPNKDPLEFYTHFTQFLAGKPSKKTLSDLKPFIVKLPTGGDAYLYIKNYFIYHTSTDKNKTKNLIKDWLFDACEAYDYSSALEVINTDFIDHFGLKVLKSIYSEFLPYLEKRYSKTDSKYLLILAHKEQISGNTETAMQSYSEAVRIDNKCWYAHIQLASHYQSNNNYQNAIKCYNHALLSSESLSENSLLSSVHFFIGYNYIKLKNFPKAIKAIKECLKITPDIQYANNDLAYSLYKNGNNTEALKYANKSIKLGSDGENPYRCKISILEKLGRIDEALKTLQQLQKISRSQVSINQLHKRLLKLKNNPSIIIETADDMELIANSNPKSHHSTSKNGSDGMINHESILEDLLYLKIQRQETVFGRSFSIYDDEDYHGKQIIMPQVGRLDLLLQEAKTNDLYVLELKKDSGYNADAVEQTLGYMSWIKQNLASPKQKVKGIICLYKATPDLLEEASKHNIEVQEYEFQFCKAN